MNRFALIIPVIICCIVSCQRDNIDDPTKTTGRDYFKLQSIKTFYASLSTFKPLDSTTIKIDSVNNKIILVDYYNFPDLSDSAVTTYTYNSSNQLTLYERTDTYHSAYNFYISRMEFVR